MLPTVINDVSGDLRNCCVHFSNDDCRLGYHRGNCDESCDADASIGGDCGGDCGGGDGCVDIPCNRPIPDRADLDTAYNNLNTGGYY